MATVSKITCNPDTFEILGTVRLVVEEFGKKLTVVVVVVVF